MWKGFSDEIKAILTRDGLYHAPSEYDEEPYEITMRLIDEGRDHLILGAAIPLRVPVRILDVPWQHALRLAEALASDDVTITLSKSGDHRLSTQSDIARLIQTVETLLAEIEG